MGQFVSENWPMWRGAGGQSTGGPPAVTSSTDLLHSGLYPFVESLAKLCKVTHALYSTKRVGAEEFICLLRRKLSREKVLEQSALQ